jgi:L-iditol 2-dehydrogenase
VRAVVLDEEGLPHLADVPTPGGDGTLVRVLACGLCGSDVEKFDPANVGRVLGHEIVGRVGGKRVALLHHAPCGECARCLAGHESTCESFSGATIRPGGFAERVRADAWVEVPAAADDAQGTMIEPLACALRGAERVPRGRVLIVGHGFIGHLFSAVLERRGDDVFAIDANPTRTGRKPRGPVEATVVCAPGGVETAIEAVEPGGTILLFADAGSVPAAPVYRRELTMIGSRSATPRHMKEAAALLPELQLPEPTVLPLDRFAEGLELYRRGVALKVVFRP